MAQAIGPTIRASAHIGEPLRSWKSLHGRCHVVRPEVHIGQHLPTAETAKGGLGELQFLKPRHAHTHNNPPQCL
jgi:hypothetical protein